MSDEVTISREDFDNLLHLAEDSLYVQWDEYSNNPTDEDRELMLALWKIAGKEVPMFFARTFHWEQQGTNQ